ncbi:MAG TPA: DUF2460 domain-containing protein [Stellaceae bacterium]|jgi:uncharacterized protein (TIGR02217 family)|nr:DUF2460 domain-containing protein [Stellaceae bacterium]
MIAIFPVLPGLGWSIKKAPRFATRTQRAVSGRELRVLDQPVPIWTWTLTYALLRDQWDARAPGGPGVGYDELRTIAGFFLQQQGSFAPFLFHDPSDDAVSGQMLGTGDSSANVFQLVRNMGGFTEPITAPDTVDALYCNGVRQDSASYAIDAATGQVTFTTPPTAGQAITADFTYRFRVRFADDTLEFENFMYQLWQLKQVKLQSVLP